jgi:hypothetical protein
MEPENTEVQEIDLYEVIKVAEEVGVTYRRLDYYIRKGYLHCENAFGGSGNGPRLLVQREVDVLRLMCKFIEVGFLPEPAALLARRMVFDQSPITTLPGGIIITLTKEPDSGTGQAEDL